MPARQSLLQVGSLLRSLNVPNIVKKRKKEENKKIKIF
jgi:hypothetical protein